MHHKARGTRINLLNRLSGSIGLAAILCCVCTAHAQTLRYGNSGLTSLTYAGTDLLSNGEPRVTAVVLQDAAGQTSLGSLDSTLVVDAATNLIGRQYSWGLVKLQYAVSSDKVALTVTVQNNSSATLQSVSIEPLVLRLPAKPAEYDGNTPIIFHNIGSPTVLPLTYGVAMVAVANEDTEKPLVVGSAGAIDSPANLTFPLLILTGKSSKLPDRIPAINRPIAPGASDQYQISLRFGPVGSAPGKLAGDIYQRFGARNPVRFNWADKRPIGALFLATANAGWPTNPRGWFLDPSIDVSSEEGRARFRSRVLAWADESIEVLRTMNAQGMIAWDLEGEQYPHPLTYVGDPRLIGTLAPEMEPVVDEFFRKFRDAGLAVGLCVRPQQFVIGGGTTAAAQREASDPAQVLIEKIDYAKRRWGVSLVYIDSNGDPSLPIDSSIFQSVANVHPDVLLIPEHENFQYFTAGAPYNELRGGVAGTPAAVRFTYPNAFSVINTADGPIEDRFRDLVDGVKGGDILLFRGWYPDPANSRVKDVYRFLPDAEPPSLTLSGVNTSSPQAGSITVRADAVDNVGVDGVQLELDGESFAGTDTTFPYAVSLHTALLADGRHKVRATARDLAGNSRQAELEFDVANKPAENCPWMGNGEFVGCVFSDEALANRRTQRVDREIDFDWGDGPPDVGGNATHYSALWQGVFTFEDGQHSFNVSTKDGVRLYIDDELVLDAAGGGLAGAAGEVKRKLTIGAHAIRLEYFHREGGASVRLRWQKLG